MGKLHDLREVVSAPGWLLQMLATVSNEEATNIAIVLWGIWYARNMKVWENKTLIPEITVEWSKKQVLEWKEVQKKKSNQSVPLNRQLMDGQSWVPCIEGGLKLNVDASVI